MNFFYDKNGEKIDPFTWVNLFENKTYAIIKQEHVNDYFISTVWLGLNHRFYEGLPLIFETMVFREIKEIDIERYATLEEAIEGHERMCKKYINAPYVLKDWK
ncbi:MAG: hypothetical protein WC679_13270 [Bacteroidales bacterium]|jgi:hypothetical protein